MKKLTLHIGTHKTGSTALQRFMIANAEYFEAQGLCIPVTPSKYMGIVRDRNGYFLDVSTKKAFRPDSWKSEYDSRVEKDKRFVMKAVADFDQAYLSDERIWYEAAQHPQYWQEFRKRIEECGFDDVRFVVYLRRRDQFVSSLWAQFYKKSFETVTLQDYLEKIETKNAIDYLGNLRRIEEEFGAGCVTVRVFERGQLLEGDVCKDFCSVLGIPWSDDLEQPGRLNPSLTRNVIEIKRAVNSVDAYASGSEDFLRKTVERTSAASVEERVSYFSFEERVELAKRYEADDAVIAREYLGRDDGALFSSLSVGDREWTPLTPGMIHDVCYFFTDALCMQNEHISRLQEANKALVEENRLLAEELHALAEEQSALAKEQSALAKEQRTLAKGHRALTKEHRALAKETESLKRSKIKAALSATKRHLKRRLGTGARK